MPELLTRRHLALVLLAGAAVLSGCAALRSVSVDVSSFGDWPADRKPGSYAFERLPSQQTQPELMQALEAAAAASLAKAGFQPVAAGQQPEVLVQVGQRSSRADLQPWADTLWWRGGFGYYHPGPWGGPRWGMGMAWDGPRYEREVAVLLRDRASGKPLFETHASNEGNSNQASEATLAALFDAALMDFPRTGMNPRRVVIALP